MASRGRLCCLSSSSALALLSFVIITVCLFSASFRSNLDASGGKKQYGLFRFCYEPKSGTQTREDDSYAAICHLRNYINSSQCQSFTNSDGKSSRNCFGDFELATIILLSCSMACCLLSICFSICTIFTSFGALAHTVILLAAGICSLSGFLSYTYYYELKENQYDVQSGYQFQIHYGWAYYLVGLASIIQFAAFITSLFGSAFVLVHKNKKRQSKVQSVNL